MGTKGTKTILVVDGTLDSTSIRVSVDDLVKKIVSAALMGDKPIVVLKGGRNKLAAYGEFKTEKEAEEFKADVDIECIEEGRC